MQSTHPHSRRGHQGKPAAAYSAAPVLEMLEGRQLMSVTMPTVEPMAAMPAGPLGPSMHAPLVASAGAPLSLGAGAAFDGVVDGTGTGGDGSPDGGGDTVMARSLWSRLKGAAKWVGNHIVIGLHNIGYKGTF